MLSSEKLTLAEMGELQTRYNGPIPESAVQDKLRARGAAYAAEESEDQVRARRDKFYQSACGHSAMLTFWRAKLAEGFNVQSAIDNHSLLFRQDMDATDEMDRKLDAMTAQPLAVAAE